MQTVWIFIQRLVSAPGQAEVRKAYAEFVALVASGAMLYSAFKAHDFSTIFTAGPQVYEGLSALALTIASIFSSNKSAIANPDLGNITATPKI